MTAPVIGTFKDNNLFWQSPESVAKFIVALEATPNINGKAIYIEGGAGWEFEDSFYVTQPQWLGEEATKRMRVNAEAVNKVRNFQLCVGWMLRSSCRGPSFRSKPVKLLCIFQDSTPLPVSSLHFKIDQRECRSSP
jgi:hypothetical protein